MYHCAIFLRSCFSSALADPRLFSCQKFFPFLISEMASSSVEMTGMCGSVGREKARLPVVAAEGSFGSVELMSMWEWAWLAEEQLCSP